MRAQTFMTMFVIMFGLLGCRQDMHDQAKYKPLAPSTFFTDGRSARPLVEGVIPRGYLKENEHLFTGKINGQLATTFPFEITADVLQRGKQRYQIFCTPCHDGIGSGQGMVVRRGFRRPPSLHLDRLRKAPPGYFYDVITNGFATMPSYPEQIAVKDRWAIVAYVRALQLSQNATLADVPETERTKLEASRGQ